MKVMWLLVTITKVNLCTGTISKSLNSTIENALLVVGLKHDFSSISQLCDKDNIVVFDSSICKAINSNNETKLFLLIKEVKILT